jgi:hypothetical protein
VKGEAAAMKFLSELHKSIFDPYFYREALKQSWGGVAMFLLKLMLFAAFIMCFSKTFYLLHSERGIAPLVSVMFSDMEFTGKQLATEREQPFNLPGEMLTELMNRLVGYPQFSTRLPDDFLVIDTRTTPAPNDAARIVLKKNVIEFRDIRMTMPYTVFLGNRDFHQFTTESVQAFLNENAASFALSFFMTSLFFGIFTMALSVFFLSLAAYIFRTDRASGYRRFLRIACYSITPIVLGDALVSMTGVNTTWAWHVFFVLSTLLMFRSIRRAATDDAAAALVEKIER